MAIEIKGQRVNKVVLKTSSILEHPNIVKLGTTIVWCKPFKLSLTGDGGVETITCRRNFTDEPTASKDVNIPNGDYAIFYGDELDISVKAKSGFILTEANSDVDNTIIDSVNADVIKHYTTRQLPQLIAPRIDAATGLNEVLYVIHNDNNVSVKCYIYISESESPYEYDYDFVVNIPAKSYFRSSNKLSVADWRITATFTSPNYRVNYNEKQSANYVSGYVPYKLK